MFVPELCVYNVIYNEREMGKDQIETSNKCNYSRDIKTSIMQSEAEYGKCLQQWNVERLIENWKLHRKIEKRDLKLAYARLSFPFKLAYPHWNLLNLLLYAYGYKFKKN